MEVKKHFQHFPKQVKFLSVEFFDRQSCLNICTYVQRTCFIIKVLNVYIRPTLNRAQNQTPYRNPLVSRFDCKIGTVFIFC